MTAVRYVRRTASTCEHCAFFEFEDGTCQDGECRRSQPAVFEDGLRAWPIVFRDEWCGEFRPARDDQHFETHLETPALCAEGIGR